MRICVLTQYFYPHAGGSQEYIVQLCSHLRAIDPTIEVDVICYNTDKAAKTEEYKGLHVHRIDSLQVLPGQFAIPNYWQLIMLLKKLKKAHRYDFVNSHTRFFDNSWWAPLVAKFFNAQLILTDHCASHPGHPNPVVRAIAACLDVVILHTFLKAYKNITSVSQATADFLAGYGFNSEVVVAGVDSVFEKNTKGNALSKWAVLKDATVITFLGRMIPSKNPQVLLPVAQEITQLFPNTYFVFAGGGSELTRLQKHATQKIIFTGQLKREQAAELLHQTDIFVYPSLHHEGLPIGILEAGATGCAVLATDNGGTREVIEDGVTGFIIKPTKEAILEKIHYILKHPAVMKKLGATLQEKVHREFNWKKSAKNFLQYLLSLEK